MAVIQQVLLDGMINYLDSAVQSARVKVNGTFADYPIYKTQKSGNVIRKYVYLETEEGFVEEAQLLGSGKDVLAKRPFAINKQEDGLVLVFQFTIDVREG